MDNNSKSKFFWLVGILFLIVVGILFFRNLNSPYRVTSPENYPAGTKVSLYKDKAPSFPAEIIVENKPLNYSGEVLRADGKTETTVSYVSDQSVLTLSGMYKDSLEKNGWSVSVRSATASIAVITAAKGTEKMLLTVTPLTSQINQGSMLTFQYEK